MKRLTILLAAAPFLAAIAASPASAETRSYPITGFTGITASSSSDVVLKQGPFSVVAETTNGDFKDLKVEKHGDQLVVSREWHGIGRSPRYTVTVTAPSISSLRASSSADIVASGYTFKDLSVNVNSSGNVRLGGTCTSIDVDVSSSGDFVGTDLKCDTATVQASSSGDADVFASRSARGSASSSGDIRFHGKPADFDKKTSSSGSVKVL